MLGVSNRTYFAYESGSADNDEVKTNKYLRKLHEFNESPFLIIPRADNIIHVPLIAYGGFLQGYANKVYIDSLERYSLPGITGEHYSFEVDGMSMYDFAAPGDYAIAKPIEKFEWMTPRRAYVLQTTDGLLIKYFEKLSDSTGHFYSANKEYPPVDIPLKSLKKVYFVDRILKKI